jgi:hypothetical protein
MQTPRSYTETCTAMSKPSLGRTSTRLLSLESPLSSPNPGTWPTVVIETTTPESGKSRLSLPPNSLMATLAVSKPSSGMSLPMLSSSILGKMRYGAWLDGMARSCHEAQKDALTGSLKSSGTNPFTMTKSSSKPSPEEPDQDPATWGSKDTQ